MEILKLSPKNYLTYVVLHTISLQKKKKKNKEEKEEDREEGRKKVVMVVQSLSCVRLLRPHEL